jgi:ATP-dependent Clp protease adaptor protein ClpS
LSGPEASRYQIVFLNDDFTAMEFVVHVLEDIFKMSREEATRAMLHTHRRGTLPIATMEKAEAEATVKTIHERARAAGHPFQCIVQAATSD